MNTIKLLREEVQNSNINLKNKVTNLELVESPSIFCETNCSYVGLIEEAYINMTKIITEIKNIGNDNYEASEKAALNIEELDHELGGKMKCEF
ncbi:MAG: hypothetical protein ACK5LZ_03140 [Anaerorhabdus sp.]